jgi:hypothetical protein
MAAAVVNQILDGVLWGAADYSLNRDAITPPLADTWLRTVDQVVSNWRFDLGQRDDGKHFPIHALSNMLDGKSSSPEPSVIYTPEGRISQKKLENPAGSWNNVGGNTSPIFQNKGAFE